MMGDNSFKVRYYVCSNCGSKYGIGFVNTYPETINNCPKCGATLIKKCPKCEKLIEKPDETYCPYCGTKYLQK